MMNFIPIRTRIVKPPKDEIWDILDGLEIKDGDIVFITSKILAIHQGRCVKGVDKRKLVKQESSHYLPQGECEGFMLLLTINNNTVIPNAGIDESNGDGYYVLWPKGIDKACREIRTRLIRKHKIRNLGVVVTDSHMIAPLRWGVGSISIGLAGVKPIRDLRSETDLFGRKLVCTRVGIIDPLASAAGLLMGEKAEQTPIVILRGFDGVTFDENASMKDFFIAPEDDLYTPLVEIMERN
jgi:F420-0:gamma-glutamyl ligase